MNGSAYWINVRNLDLLKPHPVLDCFIVGTALLSNYSQKPYEILWGLALFTLLFTFEAVYLLLLTTFTQP